MLDSSLHYPDKPEWRQEAAYRDTVAVLLKEIFHGIHHPDLVDRPYQRAIEQAEHCLPLPMSDRQRMLMRWAQSMGYIGLKEWRQGSDSLDSALELAEQLNDLSSCAEIAFMNGSACASDLNYESAREYNNLTLSLLRRLSRSEESIDPSFESHVLLNQASCHFTLEMYEDAKTNLRDATTLITLPTMDFTQDSGQLRHIANIYWVEAVLQRWIGVRETALHLALKAYEIYSHLPPLTVLTQVATISSVIAETAIDLADGISLDPLSGARMSYLQIAEPYIQIALEAAYTAQDDLTAGIALLADARYQVAHGQQLDFVSYISSVLKTASVKHNPALAIQAYSTLGKAFSHHGEDTAAVDCFRNAIELARASSLPSMSIWARRALLWESELH